MGGITGIGLLGRGKVIGMGMVDSVSCGQSGKLVKPIVLTSLADLVGLAPFACVASIVIALVEGDLGDGLWASCAVMGVLLVARFFLERLAINASFSDGYRVSGESRTRLAEHIRTLPIGDLDEAGQASLTTSLMSDIALTERGLTHVLPQVASGIVVVAVGSLALAAIDWRLALASFLGLPACIAVLALGRGRRRRGDGRLSAARVEVAASVQDLLYGIEPVKTSAGARLVMERIDRVCEEYREACVSQERVTGAFNALAAGALKIGLPAMLACAALLHQGSGVDLAVLVVFIMVGMRMYDPLVTAVMNWAELEASARAGERVLSILSMEPMRGDGIACGDSLAFKGVTFSYDGAKDAVSHVDLSVPRGARVALVGPSGSGKSTMLKLAARFYDPTAGEVALSGVDASGVSPESFYESVSMVFQDVFVFHDTVEANIRYGRESATHDEVVAAAKAARCHEFVTALPNGYDTVLGERGSTLSGGERQRIAIARAILKDAPIVLLDEAMRALDPINEREVRKAVSALLAGRTVIMVAHGLASVRGVDEIAVMDGGEIVERGTHEELMRLDGLYARLSRIQEQSAGWRIA